MKKTESNFVKIENIEEEKTERSEKGEMKQEWKTK